MLNSLFKRALPVGAVLVLIGSLGCSSLTNSAELQPVLDLSVKWIKPTLPLTYTGPRTLNPMSPILTDELVIQGNSINGIGAFNRVNGQTKWWLPIEGGVSGGATAIKDNLFFGGSDGMFYGVSISDGKVLWSIPIRSESLSAPLLHEGVLYFLSGINTVYAIDASDGKQVWLYPRQDPSGFSIRGGSKPVIHDGVVYAGFSDGFIVALDQTTGSPLWEKLLNRNKKFRDIDSSPFVDGERLYVAGFDDAIYALDLKSGQVLWSHPQGGFGPVQSDGQLVYVASTNNSLLALDKSSGKPVWEYEFGEGIASGPQLTDSMVVTTLSAGPVTFLDKTTGDKLAQFAPGSGSFSLPVVDAQRNQLYFMSQGAHLYAIHFNWQPRPDSFPKLHDGQRYRLKGGD